MYIADLIPKSNSLAPPEKFRVTKKHVKPLLLVQVVPYSLLFPLVEAVPQRRCLGEIFICFC